MVSTQRRFSPAVSKMMCLKGLPSALRRTHWVSTPTVLGGDAPGSEDTVPRASAVTRVVFPTLLLPTVTVETRTSASGVAAAIAPRRAGRLRVCRNAGSNDSPSEGQSHVEPKQDGVQAFRLPAQLCLDSFNPKRCESLLRMMHNIRFAASVCPSRRGGHELARRAPIMFGTILLWR
jgi:hypothetical protein